MTNAHVWTFNYFNASPEEVGFDTFQEHLHYVQQIQHDSLTTIRNTLLVELEKLDWSYIGCPEYERFKHEVLSKVDSCLTSLTTCTTQVPTTVPTTTTNGVPSGS